MISCCSFTSLHKLRLLVTSVPRHLNDVTYFINLHPVLNYNEYFLEKLPWPTFVLEREILIIGLLFVLE